MYPNLKLQLWRTGIRQNQLAKMLGMDETMLSRIVNGYRSPKAEFRKSIANFLSCDPGWLFEKVEAFPQSRRALLSDIEEKSKPH